MEKYKPLVSIFFFSLLFFNIGLSTVFAQTQEKTYWIDSSISKIHINKDSTVSVDEKITFHFIGSFHNVWRDISTQKISKITDVKVYDNNKRPLAFERLQKKGVYRITTHFNKDNTYGVLPDGTLGGWEKTLYFTYKIHGAISFLKDKDGLYINAFTNWPVQVRHAVVQVVIPTLKTDEIRVYTEPQVPITKSVSKIDGATMVSITTQDVFPAYGKLSVAATWEKGIINRSGFWKGLILDNTAWIIAFLALLISILYAIIFWFISAYLPRKNGTIIAEYEPPMNMSPEEMFFLSKGRISLKRIIPAMIVQMAFKGALRIEDDTPQGFWKRVAREASVRGVMSTMVFIILTLVLLVIISGFTLVLLIHIITNSFSFGLPLYLTFLFFLFLFFYRMHGLFPKDYLLHIDPTRDDTLITDSEKEILDFLMTFGAKDKDTFSTYEIRKHLYQHTEESTTVSILRRKIKLDISNRITHSFDQFYNNSTHTDSEQYTEMKQHGSIYKTLTNKYVLVIIFIVGGFIFKRILQEGMHTALIIQIGVFGAALFIYIISTHKLRFNLQGNELYRKVGGFKMYLETAERYRLENLTQETFERFLPYAMIFGIEKKWSQSLKNLGMSLKNPHWYVAMNGYHNTTNITSSLGASISSSISSSLFPTHGVFGARGAGGGAGGGGGGAS